MGVFEVPHLLSCPTCGRGSDSLYESATGRSEWETITCPACEEPFEIASAVDNMLLEGGASGYALWAGIRLLAARLQCVPGEVGLVDIRGEFDEVMHIEWGASGSWLGGGIATKNVPQGYVLVAISPSPGGVPDRPIDMLISIVGRPSEVPLEPWRRMILEARISAVSERVLPPILAVAGIDAFLETATGQEVQSGRPASWSPLVESLTEKPLKDVLPGSFKDLETAVAIRNDFAHGKDPKRRMPGELAAAESEHEKRFRQLEGHGRVFPSTKHVLAQSLGLVRAVRRLGNFKQRHVRNTGLVPDA